MPRLVICCVYNERCLNSNLQIGTQHSEQKPQTDKHTVIITTAGLRNVAAGADV